MTVLADTFARHPDSQLFIIGPCSSIGRYLHAHSHTIGRATMQGGFLPSDSHATPCHRLEAFAGKDWVPTFNFNGHRRGVERLIGADIADRAFVGKNVCHAIVYTREHFERMRKPTFRAGELFLEGMKLYLERHEEKKFHDPAAAACHLHPDIGTWVRGRPAKLSGGWTTIVGEGDRILADIDRTRLWEHLYSLT